MVKSWLVKPVRGLVTLENNFICDNSCFNSLFHILSIIKYFYKIADIVKNEEILENWDNPGILVKNNIIDGFKIIVILLYRKFLRSFANLPSIKYPLLSRYKTIVASIFRRQAMRSQAGKEEFWFLVEELLVLLFLDFVFLLHLFLLFQLSFEFFYQLWLA